MVVACCGTAVAIAHISVVWLYSFLVVFPHCAVVPSGSYAGSRRGQENQTGDRTFVGPAWLEMVMGNGAYGVCRDSN